MNWNEYQQQAMSTAIFPVDRSLDYTVLGLCSEVAELGAVFSNHRLGVIATEKAAKAESGDCWWYTAAIATTLGKTLEQLAPPLDERQPRRVNYEHFSALVIASGNLAGIVKKAIRDNGGHLSAEGEDNALNELRDVVRALVGLAWNNGSGPEGVWAYNLDKLASRKKRDVLTGSGDDR
jgi:hypothetical protein